MVTTRDTAPSRERRLVETFVELADTLVEDFDVVEFFSSLAERVVQLGIASEAGILLVDEAGDLQFVAASHERTHLLELFQVQNEEGPCQDCFSTGAPVSVVDLDAASDRWPLFAPRAVSAGFRSVQAVPLRLRGAVLGALNLFLTDPGGIDHEAEAVVQAMADVATIGLLQQRELDRAHAVEGQLQRALQTRIGIEQAKGIVSERMGIPMDAAFVLLRGYSRNRNQKLHDVARDVVGGCPGCQRPDMNVSLPGPQQLPGLGASWCVVRRSRSICRAPNCPARRVSDSRSPRRARTGEQAGWP